MERLDISIKKAPVTDSKLNFISNKVVNSEMDEDIDIFCISKFESIMTKNKEIFMNVIKYIDEPSSDVVIHCSVSLFNLIPFKNMVSFQRTKIPQKVANFYLSSNLELRGSSIN